jgi:hypothetical protein
MDHIRKETGYITGNRNRVVLTNPPGLYILLRIVYHRIKRKE